MSMDRALEVRKQVQSLLGAGFFYMVTDPTWLSNIIMVKSSNGKWGICIVYIDLNKAYPKDSYPCQA